MSQLQTCYMCENPATTKEHAPPKSFFPPHFRKNLIKVPSCKEHNNEKSKDDEFLRFVISLNYESNIAGQNLFSTKVAKSLYRKPQLLSSFIIESYPAIVNGELSMAIKYDYDRYIKAMNYMARAVHFHHFKTKWDEEIVVLPASARYPYEDPKHEEKDAQLDILKYGEMETPKYGENQEIFYYQFLLDNEDNTKRLRMAFFNGHITYVFSRKIIAK